MGFYGCFGVVRVSGYEVLRLLLGCEGIGLWGFTVVFGLLGYRVMGFYGYYWVMGVSGYEVVKPYNNTILCPHDRATTPSHCACWQLRHLRSQ